MLLHGPMRRAVHLGRARAARGATLVEYALLIIVVMLLGASAYRELGKSVRKASDNATEELMK